MPLADRTSCTAASSLPCWGRKSVFSSTQPVPRARPQAAPPAMPTASPAVAAAPTPAAPASVPATSPAVGARAAAPSARPPRYRRLRPHPRRQRQPHPRLLNGLRCATLHPRRRSTSLGRPMICGGGCAWPGRGSTFKRTYSAASWGS